MVRTQVTEEKDSLEEMQIFGAAGEERAQGEVIAFGVVDVKGGEVRMPS